MSIAVDIIRPIFGLATNQFTQISDTQFVFSCLYLPLQCATLLFWAIILVAFFRDRHYEDPNNLLIASFALADIVCISTSLHSALSNVLDHGYSRGFTGCIWEAYFLTVGFCASGLSVVLIALDRYLLMCHGYFASWLKTCILLLICWFIALVFPAFAIFPTLPNSIILANGVLCYPNFTSQDPPIQGMLVLALLMILFVDLLLVFCYGNVFYKYNSILLRKQKRAAKGVLTLPEKSQKLLFKLCVLTGNYCITFLPLVITLAVMMATRTEINDTAESIVLTIFEIGLLLNPILIYLLDAKMKLSVNELFGIKRKTVPANCKRVDEIKLKDVAAANGAPQYTAPIPDTVMLDTLRIRAAVS